MPGSAFVARESEFIKLKTFLGATTAGKTQVVFISGEAEANVQESTITSSTK